MGAKFYEDVIPLTDLKVNPGRVVKHATDAHRCVPRKREHIDFIA